MQRRSSMLNNKNTMMKHWVAFLITVVTLCVSCVLIKDAIKTVSGTTKQYKRWEDPIKNFPFHIADGIGAYCFKVRGSTRKWHHLHKISALNKYEKTKFKFRGKEYPYVIVKIADRGRLTVFVNKKRTWDNAIRVGTFKMDKKQFGFNLHKTVDIKDDDDERYIKILGKRYRVAGSWFLPPSTKQKKKRSAILKGSVWEQAQRMSTNVKYTCLDCMMALQRMNVLGNYKHFFPNTKPPFQVIEDAASSAAIALMAYYVDLPKYEGHSFYGGKVLKVVDVENVMVKTHEKDEPTVKAGTLRFFSWEAGGVFVVSARGTNDNDNWKINFQLEPTAVPFEPYHSSATESNKAFSGMYETLQGRLDEVLPIFDTYDPDQHKRVIITGHSLGSGIAQMLSIMLLNKKNQALMEKYPGTKALIVDRSGSKSSLEVISFGGPACMNKPLVDAGLLAMIEFNKAVPEARRPLDEYVVTVYTNDDDPVTFTGNKVVEYIRSHWVDNHPYQKPRGIMGGYTPTHILFRTRMSALSRKMAKKGLAFLNETHHYGTQVVNENSNYGTGVMKWARFGGIRVAKHGEYFDMTPLAAQLKIWMYE